MFRLQHAWHSFIELLNVSYTDGYTCPDCGPCPDIVVMDGVSVSLKKTFIPWLPVMEEPQSLDGR